MGVIALLVIGGVTVFLLGLLAGQALGSQVPRGKSGTPLYVETTNREPMRTTRLSLVTSQDSTK